MSKVLCVCAAAAAVLTCGALAEAAQPSASKLAQMGLSGATVVSDSVAMEVRGSAIASAYADAFAKGKIAVAVQFNASQAGKKKASAVSKSAAVGIGSKKRPAFASVSGSTFAKR